MNLDNRSNRAARRVRMSQELLKLVRDELQEAEAALYINGAVRHVDEANALTRTSDALNELDSRVVNLMMLLGNIKDREAQPQPQTEFDDLALIAQTEGIFRDAK